jgi:hypothetical protein
MIELFGIVAPPRSGTKWFANLFTDGETHCFHELLTLISGWPTRATLTGSFQDEAADHDLEQLTRRFFLDPYPTYFERLLERDRFGQRFAGNSDNGLVAYASGMWLLWPRTRFVFSLRNGISQVDSVFRNEPRVLPVARAERGAAGDPFAFACDRWATVVTRWQATRAWLEERGAACTSTTLEKITTDVAELERVWRFVVGEWEAHAERAISLMDQPLNRRSDESGGIRTPDEIWDTWSDEQRATFTRLSSGTQLELGYPLPS